MTPQTTDRLAAKAATSAAIIDVVGIDDTVIPAQMIAPAPGAGLAWVRPVELTGRELTGALLVSTRRPGRWLEWRIPAKYRDAAADLAAGRLPARGEVPRAFPGHVSSLHR